MRGGQLGLICLSWAVDSDNGRLVLSVTSKGEV